MNVRSHPASERRIGPPIDAVELGIGPVLDLVAATMLRGEPELSPDVMLAVALADDLDLGWLPPGVEVPGLDRWRTAGDRVREIRVRP